MVKKVCESKTQSFRVCSIFALIALRKMTDYDDYCFTAVHGKGSTLGFRNMAEKSRL